MLTSRFVGLLSFSSRRRRAGYTLMEVLVSLAIASLLFLAIGSTVLIAAKAAPGRGSANDSALTSFRALQQIADEVREAIHVLSLSATNITFTVADRDGDQRLETIAYSWSGVGGEPLLRQLNQTAPAVFLPDIWQFNLACDQRVHNEQYPPALVESAEQELFKMDSTSSISNADVKADKWWGQYFKPVMSPDTKAWKVTRLSVRMRDGGGSDDQTLVRLSLPNANMNPSATVLEQLVLNEATLPDSYAWHELSFVNASGISSTQGLCLTFTSDNDSAKLEYKSGSVSLPESALLEADASGWKSPQTDKALRIYVYGTTSALPASQQTMIRTFITGARISLQTGASAAGQVQTTIGTLNAPEILAAQWELDFNVDPTTVDLDGDSVADWAAATFDTSRLVAGAWNCNRTLATAPNQPFDRATAVNVRLRDTQAGDDGPGVRLNLDRVADTVGIVDAVVTLMSDNTQTLVLYNQTPAGTQRRLATIRGLPATWLDLRLLADPVQRSINVRINESDYSTFTYQHCTQPAAAQAVELYAAAAGAEFDHVRVRLGGTTNYPPQAVAAADDNTVEEDETVSFSAAGSTDPENDALTYQWTFGDGKSGSGANVTHKYRSEGTFTATLTVTDAKGGFDTASISIKVKNESGGLLGGLLG